jgi:hypothetical protein
MAFQVQRTVARRLDERRCHDAIRAAFIRSHLEEARQHLQEPIAIRIAREFRTYLDWHASRLPETERDLILEQVVELERNLSLTATGVHTPFRC